MKTKVKNIIIIGHFGGNQNFNDGQTVKTVNLYNELKSATDWDIIKIDTYYKNKRPVRLFLMTIFYLIKIKDIFVLQSKNGMKFFFPLLFVFAKIFKNRIYHDCIGGALSAYIVENPNFVKYLNSFKKNWVETALLKKELEVLGIRNAEILPNFRRGKELKEQDLPSQFGMPFKLCTFSRVIKQKGIKEAIDAVERINKMNKTIYCTLDIYGPIDPSYKMEFERLSKESTVAIKYCGEVPTEQSIDTLRQYYSTLFPTYWEGEGQAGTISESFMAGVPVIATDWRCNSEMIQDGVDGIIYPGNNAHTLEEGIVWMINKMPQIVKIKENCLAASKYYRPDMHIKHIIDVVESN